MTGLRSLGLGIVLIATACGPKGESEGSSATADTTRAAADSSTPPGTSPTPADSVTGGETPSPAGTTAPAIGRDSAFGPKFIMDSTGKMVPVPTKRP